GVAGNDANGNRPVHASGSGPGVVVLGQLSQSVSREEVASNVECRHAAAPAGRAALRRRARCRRNPVVGSAGRRPVRPRAGAAAAALSFILDFLPNGEYGPFFVALEKGWYAEAGLDVTILRGTGSADTLRRVPAGQGDAGIGDFSAVVAARSNDNVAVKAIMVYFRRPPHSIFVLGASGIENAADLAGKTLATTAGNSHQILFPLLARTAGFDHE